MIGRLSGEYDVVMVARADGGTAADVRPLVHLAITVIAEQDGRREQGHQGAGGRFGYAYFTDDVLEGLARDAVRQALLNLEARPAPAGSMSVVLGPGWPESAARAIGHGLEGDFNRKGYFRLQRAGGRACRRPPGHGDRRRHEWRIAAARSRWTTRQPHPRTVLIEDGILRAPCRTA